MNVLLVSLFTLCSLVLCSAQCMQDADHEAMTELSVTAEVPTTTELSPEGSGDAESDKASHELENEIHFPDEATAALLRKRRKAASQAAKFSKLMVLVKASKLQDCAGRVVCDLNCDPHKHGSDGKRVLNNLEKLQTSGQIKESDLEFYVKAAVVGRKYKKPKTCGKCADDYPNCPALVADMVAVASLIKLTS